MIMPVVRMVTVFRCGYCDSSKLVPKRTQNTEQKFYDISLKSDEHQFLQRIIYSQKRKSPQLKR
jgi:hypothetical protein